GRDLADRLEAGCLGDLDVGLHCLSRGGSWVQATMAWEHPNATPGSELDAEAPRGAAALPAGALTTQTLDEHRVVREGVVVVDELVEDLVVAGGAQVEQVLDGLLLGPGVLPPLVLEVQDLPVAVGQGG